VSAPVTLPPEALRETAASREAEADCRDHNENSCAFLREDPTSSLSGSAASGEAFWGRLRPIRSKRWSGPMIVSSTISSTRSDSLQRLFPPTDLPH